MWNVECRVASQKQFFDKSIFNHEKHERHEIVASQFLPQRKIPFRVVANKENINLIKKLRASVLLSFIFLFFLHVFQITISISCSVSTLEAANTVVATLQPFLVKT